MFEAEFHRVKPLSFQTNPGGKSRVGAIGQITYTRMFQGCHVNPDLMSPTGFQMHLEKTGETVSFEGFIMSDRWLPAILHREFPIRLDVPADGSIDRS